LAQSSPYKSAVLLTLLCLTMAYPANGQQVADFARADQMVDLQKQMESVSNGVRTHIAESQASMANLGTSDRSEASFRINAYFDGIEQQARVVMGLVSINGPYMDALDDTRTKIISMIGRFEQEAPSPSRDARLARLQSLKAEYEGLYDKIIQSDKQMSSLIVRTNLARGEILKDIQVDEIADVVAKLSKVSEGLSQMADLLDQVSKSAVETPEQAVAVSNE
jgi:hypothetical protein